MLLLQNVVYYYKLPNENMPVEANPSVLKEEKGEEVVRNEFRVVIQVAYQRIKYEEKKGAFAILLRNQGERRGHGNRSRMKWITEAKIGVDELTDGDQGGVRLNGYSTRRLRENAMVITASCTPVSIDGGCGSGFGLRNTGDSGEECSEEVHLCGLI
ncbi:hypothetical protein F5148DRAFT_1146315 [Russula earlei]|uniref:Uncharacterized protein n=1 Tax=Russula earlei TaxID=71964 RepID=A0ACC0ULZ0_9AGAM|nr:hypothetical protein F5148DRAFT_1146315 [Russula earlei]